MSRERRHRDLAILDQIVEDFTPEKLDDWIRKGAELFESDFVESKLRVKYREGLHLSAMCYMLREECSLSPTELKQLRMQGKLSKVIEGCLKAVARHDEHCTNGAECEVLVLPDATIFASVAKDWCIAMCVESDARDFHLMVAEAKRWRNWREVNKPSDGEALH